MSETSYEEDVRFIGAFARGGKWEIALRIARRVEVAAGNGVRGPAGGKAANIVGSFSHERHSMRKVAEDTGLAQRTVQKYLATWEWAANDGIVDPSAELSLDTEYDWEASGIGQQEWSEYYDTAMLNPPPWNPQGAPLEPRVGPNRNVAKEYTTVTPEKVAEAIRENPEVAKAARETVVQQEIERDAARRGADRTVTDRQPGAPRTEREAADDDDQFAELLIKMRAMRRIGQEALGLTLNIRGQRMERAAVVDAVNELRTLLTAIQEAAEGRSMDDELASLLEGNGS